MPTNPPSQYLLYNSEQTKQVSLVVQIDGLETLLSNRPIYTRIRYGDPGLEYGEPGLIYGGLRLVDGVNDILSLDGSSLTVSQRLEPEQGRASVSMLTLAFIDYQEFMSRLIAPGVVLDDILGKGITVFLGYAEISYPEDYFTIFRGRISGITSESGVVTLQISDPNITRRQNIFITAKTQLDGSINNSQTSLNVIANGDFYQSVLGPDGNYDPAIKLYMQVDDEWIEYGPSYSLPSAAFGTNSFTGVLRAQRGTSGSGHSGGSDVASAIELTGNAMDLALKIMMSGYGGSWIDDIAVQSIVFSEDPLLGNISGAIVLPDQVSAVRDYGLVIGDYVTISGASNPANNTTGRITRFVDLFEEPSRIIVTDASSMVAEFPTSAVASFRSQYDVFPDFAGCKLTNQDVDVQAHTDLRNQFLGGSEYTLRLFNTDLISGKTFIESELYLPTGAYSLTQRGKLSVGLTHPPIADQRLIFLNEDNILDPDKIKPSRELNNRKFWNEIDWEYDADDGGNFRSSSRYLDSESLSVIGLSQALPISSKGGKTDLGFASVVERSSRFLLSRYKRGATIIPCKVNWEVGSLIESGDVLVLDGENLFISNFQDGTRDFGVQLFEVVDRSLDIKTGNVSLKIINGLGAQVTDRYATISPSSLIGTGSTSTAINIIDSFGILYPGDEQQKWIDYVGLEIMIHSADYSVTGTCILTGFSPTNPYQMTTTDLGFAPPADYIVDFVNFPTDPDKRVYELPKLVHCFLDATVTVVTGIDDFNFTVAHGDIDKFVVGFAIRIHSADFITDSGDVDIFISAVDTGTDTVTVSTTLGFTPSPGDLCDLLGFPDGSNAYRFI